MERTSPVALLAFIYLFDPTQCSKIGNKNKFIPIAPSARIF
jgi:hypothetical protein